VAAQGPDQLDWGSFTYARVRVLRGLADFKSEREIAGDLGVAYTTIRTHVSQLKLLTGFGDVREMARWWRECGCGEWLEWCRFQAGGVENYRTDGTTT